MLLPALPFIRRSLMTLTASSLQRRAMVDVYFEGQKEAAIRSLNAGMAIVNMKVKNVPVGVLCDNQVADRLFIEDSFFENVKTAVVVTAAEGANNETNLLNVHCKSSWKG